MLINTCQCNVINESKKNRNSNSGCSQISPLYVGCVGGGFMCLNEINEYTCYFITSSYLIENILKFTSRTLFYKQIIRSVWYCGYFILIISKLENLNFIASILQYLLTKKLVHIIEVNIISNWTYLNAIQIELCTFCYKIQLLNYSSLIKCTSSLVIKYASSKL